MTAFLPPDPNYAERVRASFARQQVMAWLGATLSEIGAGICEIRLPYRPELSQQNGYFHAGIIATIADSAAGYAGYSLLPSGADVLSVEYKINLLSPGDGDLLIARGEVVKVGRTLAVCRADVQIIKDSRSKPCATLQQTLIVMRGRREDCARA